MRKYGGKACVLGQTVQLPTYMISIHTKKQHNITENSKEKIFST